MGHPHQSRGHYAHVDSRPRHATHRQGRRLQIEQTSPKHRCCRGSATMASGRQAEHSGVERCHDLPLPADAPPSRCRKQPTTVHTKPQSPRSPPRQRFARGAPFSGQKTGWLRTTRGGSATPTPTGLRASRRDRIALPLQPRVFSIRQDRSCVTIHHEFRRRRFSISP